MRRIHHHKKEIYERYVYVAPDVAKSFIFRLEKFLMEAFHHLQVWFISALISQIIALFSNQGNLGKTDLMNVRMTLPQIEKHKSTSHDVKTPVSTFFRATYIWFSFRWLSLLFINDSMKEYFFKKQDNWTSKFKWQENTMKTFNEACLWWCARSGKLSHSVTSRC